MKKYSYLFQLNKDLSQNNCSQILKSATTSADRAFASVNLDVDGSYQLSIDSQSKSDIWVCGLVATRRSVCIHQMNRVNSRNGSHHHDSTINIVVVVIIIIIIILLRANQLTKCFSSVEKFAVDRRVGKAVVKQRVNGNVKLLVNNWNLKV